MGEHPIELASLWLAHTINDTDDFDARALRQLTDLRTFKGRFTCLLPVTPDVCNRYGGLHGGCIATMVDTIGTAALLTLTERSGVSLAINVTYLSPAQRGSTVAAEARVVKVGRSIATINVELTDAVSGRVVAQGTHVKFIAAADKAFPTDDEAALRRQLPAAPRSKL